MAPTVVTRGKKPYSRSISRPQGADGQWLHDKAPGVPRAVQNSVEKAPSGITNTKIIVSNLHYEVTPKDLSQIFGQIGTLVREPQIRYDRSGRSSGVAVITFETPAEATRAKNQFDGILCKNQPMSIGYEALPAKTTRIRPSLINRIEKPALLHRLSKIEGGPHQAANTRGSVGPVRTKARGGAPGARTSKRAAPATPKTAEELDKELDAFMKDDITAQPSMTTTTTTASTEGDVEMA